MDYDFITTCNWTSTGTFTLQAYRGSTTSVVTSYSLFYRKKGAADWIETTNGQVIIDSTGEWEIANDWNKSGDDVLTHSYYGITAINSCTDVYFDEDALGATVGDYFLYNCWTSCTNLASMPVGFNLPSGITTVGDGFLAFCWRNCSSLTSMPVGFNLPSGITTVGANFLAYCWYDCTKLASMPVGFNLPSEITTVGDYFLAFCWRNCTSLASMPVGFNLPSEITTVGDYFLAYCWYDCTKLASMPVGFNIPSGITSVGANFLYNCWPNCTSLASMPVGFNLPSEITTVGDNFLRYCWYNCSNLSSMPVGFNLPSGITTAKNYFLAYCWYDCTKLASMPVGFNLPSGITTVGANFLYDCWYNCTNLKADGYTENITFEFNATNVFAGTCPLEPDSVTASEETPVNVAVNRQLDIVLTGTITESVQEDAIVSGGKTIILTIVGDTWVADDGTFAAVRQSIIDGIDSAQAEVTGWDAEVKAKQSVNGVVRTSDTIVTITLDAQTAYDITANETITATIPAAALVKNTPIIATPTFVITNIALGPVNLKTWNGIPKASIKTINGVVIAGIKSCSGIV